MDLSERKASTTMRHPWEVARARFFLDVIKSRVPVERPLACMDVGCGDAWFLGSLYEDLPPGSEAYGLDTALDGSTLAALAASAPQGVRLVNEEPDRTFDLLCLMDVCEHVDDDRGFLAGIVARRLRRDGWMLFSVPAWPQLFSAHDTALRHFRRYTPAAGRALLESAGVEVVASGGLFHSLVAPRLAQVAWEKVRKPAPSAEVVGIGSWNAPSLVTGALTLALEADGAVSRAAAALKLEVPGLSWVGAMQKTIVVVPCFNEAARLDVEVFTAFLRGGGGETSLLFVDDGSRDATREVLQRLVALTPASAALLPLDVNGGKAEAVRAGMLHALSGGADITGYLDADLATPLDELTRLRALLLSSGRSAALASRIRMLGSTVERGAARHYLGRVFATLASLTLELPVYDTQCGAKVFRCTPALQAALATPFESRWAFDVELLARLCLGADDMIEMPVREWHDVAGSKMTLKAALRMGTDLARIWRGRRG